jgi:hypothetical protein
LFITNMRVTERNAGTMLSLEGADGKLKIRDLTRKKILGTILSMRTVITIMQ